MGSRLLRSWSGNLAEQVRRLSSNPGGRRWCLHEAPGAGGGEKPAGLGWALTHGLTGFAYRLAITH